MHFSRFSQSLSEKMQKTRTFFGQSKNNRDICPNIFKNYIMKRKMFGLGGLIISLVLCLTCTTQATAQSSNQDTRKKKVADLHLDAQQYMEILGAAITTLQGQYVDTIDWGRALAAGIDAMLADLDPYCEFYSEEDQSNFRTMTTGEYGGIGALIQQRGDTVIIANPYEGRPAQEAGVRVGDAILNIDGESMIKKTTAQVSDKLRGQAGTSFTLRVKRPFVDEPMEFQITRRKIVMDAVPYSGWLNDSIGYIFLSSFTDKAAQEVQDALLTLRHEQDEQRHLKGLVFDLRENGGGLLEEAVKIVGMFVPKGSPVVETKAKRPEWNSSYRTNSVPLEPDLPIVCLIDRNSASASEILTGSLQDLDRAVIMGERSYGKGLVQSTRQLPYNTLCKFTTAKYYIPSGRCIQAIDYNMGQAEQIPDSLTHVFYTSNGREVRDGRGIKPDIEHKPQQMSGLAYYLDREYLISDYATRYRHEHESIAPIGQFHLSDQEYADFCQRALSTKKDSILTVLRVFDMKHDLDSLSAEIRQDIENEIALRYYYQRGQSQQSLLGDELVKSAALVAADEERCCAILNSTDKKKKKK